MLSLLTTRNYLQLSHSTLSHHCSIVPKSPVNTSSPSRGWAHFMIEPLDPIGSRGEVLALGDTFRYLY